MHEQSLVRNLLKQVDQIRRDHGASRVAEVRVELGPLSGVEPALLTSAFEQLANDETVDSASLVIDEVELIAKCEACQTEFEVQDFQFRCPDCEGNVKVIQGDELLLISVCLDSEALAQETTT
jgi:hydrogenase nickel incorporation protein HypA/HybF